MSIAAAKTVCVTGASGYIASWLVKFLLHKGYTVKASVRDPSDSKKTQHLLALDGAKERLHLMKANLLEEGSFDSVVNGCEGVFHTASPFYHAVTDPQAHVRKWERWTLLVVHGMELEVGVMLSAEGFTVGLAMSTTYTCSIGVLWTRKCCSTLAIHKMTSLPSNIGPEQLELSGTIRTHVLMRYLRSCAKAPSVKRIVLTSSVAAVAYNGKPRTPEVVVDETWWSSPEVCEQMQMWYVLSKTLAEDAAWKFVKEKGIEMVTINPAMVIGPLLQPTLNTSSAAILNLINGAETYPNSTFGWINVKDVARAHILAFENPSANGRYCLVERVAHLSEIVKILRELYPTYKLPEKCADDKPFVPLYQVSKEKSISLGVEFTPLEEGIKETVESLKEKKLFKPPSAI
ncbi:hypothetical protein SASPL_105034 [Salvia splendens]|uniref:Dihydroflavonol 4-reductase n=1 Tax=Salvia splendens TaxID=180675 RepID=A0A8X8YKJ2_SALSN|nr:hypothetical protein SASPL_105034 [Salvia splendens]